jgi:hypothetical protein
VPLPRRRRARTCAAAEAPHRREPRVQARRRGRPDRAPGAEQVPRHKDRCALPAPPPLPLDCLWIGAWAAGRRKAAVLARTLNLRSVPPAHTPLRRRPPAQGHQRRRGQAHQHRHTAHHQPKVCVCGGGSFRSELPPGCGHGLSIRSASPTPPSPPPPGPCSWTSPPAAWTPSHPTRWGGFGPGKPVREPSCRGVATETHPATSNPTPPSPTPRAGPDRHQGPRGGGRHDRGHHPLAHLLLVLAV